jgi:hypothetical protein
MSDQNCTRYTSVPAPVLKSVSSTLRIILSATVRRSYRPDS